MPQTRRKRRSKHRGNAVGRIERKGRTSKPAATSNKKAAGTSKSGNKSSNQRALKPPTWQSSMIRAAVACVIFFVVITLFLKKPLAGALPLTGIMFALYIPLTFYTDQWTYKRRIAQKAKSQVVNK